MEKTLKNFISTDICWLPLNSVEVKGEKLKIILEFLEELEENDDIQKVYTNLITGINKLIEMVRYSKQEEVGHCHLEYID